MDCNKCENENPSYYNYCKNDGEDLSDYKKKITLKSSVGSNCTECGSSLQGNESYCTTCGNMFSKASRKSEVASSENIKELGSNLSESALKTAKQSLNGFNASNLRNLDIKGLGFSVGLTILLTGIAIAILSMIFSPENLGLASPDASYGMQYYQELMPSKFKLFMYSLAVVNSPNILVSLKMALLNMGEMSIGARFILYPLMTVLFSYISTRVCLDKEKTRGKILEHSIAYSVIYAVVMTIIALIAGYSITSEGLSIIVKLGIVSVFINSFIVSLLGAYLGISKGQSQSFINYSFNKSLKTILIGFATTSVGVGIMLYVMLMNFEENNGISFSEYSSYHINNSKLVLFILLAVVVLSLLGAWLFVLSNFASISILGITSYNIFSLSSETSFITILFVIIPILLLIMVGRKMKSTYGEENVKLIGIFSFIYTLLMSGFAYFTRFVFSMNLGQFQGYINDFIYNMVGNYSYEYAGTVQKYLDQLYSSVNSGLYVGPSIFSVIIASFIFSFVFVYIGCKTKKVQ